jgi:hypothetical protein
MFVRDRKKLFYSLTFPLGNEFGIEATSLVGCVHLVFRSWQENKKQIFYLHGI